MKNTAKVIAVKTIIVAVLALIASVAGASSNTITNIETLKNSDPIDFLVFQKDNISLQEAAILVNKAGTVLAVKTNRVSVEVAEVLANFQGNWLVFTVYQGIESEAATAAATFNGRKLDFYTKKPLSQVAVKAISTYEGDELFCMFAKGTTREAIAELTSFKGKKLLIYLENEDFRKVEGLKSFPGEDLVISLQTTMTSEIRQFFEDFSKSRAVTVLEKSGKKDEDGFYIINEVSFAKK